MFGWLGRLNCHNDEGPANHSLGLSSLISSLGPAIINTRVLPFQGLKFGLNWPLARETTLEANAARRAGVLSLPMFAEIAEKQQRLVIELIREF